MLPSDKTFRCRVIPDRRFREMWGLSVEDANECEDCTDLTGRYRRAYLSNGIRLTHFASTVVANAKFAEQREGWQLEP